MNKKVQRGDQVIVVAGNDRGKTGKVLRREGNRLVVEGVNLRKKHIKKTQERPKGQIVDIERPIEASNVMVAVDGKPIKLKVRFNERGDKEFYYLSGKKQVLYRALKKNK